jgi:putative membrane protein
MAKFKLKDSDRQKIAAAVKKAESRTSGEIVTSFIQQSYDYAVYELVFAIVVSFLYFIFMLFFISEIELWLQSRFWNYSSAHLIAFYGFTIFIWGTVLYFLANIAFLDRLIVPRKVMKRKVHERALLHFLDSGIAETRDRTGILIFISLMEHRVELLADRGINEKIDPNQWQEIVDKIVSGVKSGSFTDSLIQAVEDCGKLLAEYFPIKEDDTNELSNEIQELQK